MALWKASVPTLPDGRYLHWDELRYRDAPSGITVEQWWASTKLARRSRQETVPLMQQAFALPFAYTDLPSIRERLHRFDRANVARAVADAMGNEDATVEYQVRQLVEEAISSSLIEGARPTTRELARQMVQERRRPVSRDEVMIVNNWHAMNRVLELQAQKRPLRIEDLLELHRILGEGCLDVPGAEGQLRSSSHQVEVSDEQGNVWHTPPPAGGMRDRLDLMLRFAEGADDPFLHPVLRAILTHFWLAFEHPFRDGNGRMARALYYWCMLRHGYEMAEFLSISGPIDRSPKAYYLAFAHTETDDYDLTYFLLHQLDVMQQAMDELLAHLRRRAEHTAQLARFVENFDALNYRQRALLNHAIRHPSETYTIGRHGAAHRVHYLTARADLAGLVERGLLQDGGGRPKRFALTATFVRHLPGK